MQLIERYNNTLRTLEDGTITMLNRVLDASFNRLIRRARIQMKAPYSDPAQRNLALLQEFRQLVPAYNPERVDAYDRILRSLFQSATRYGYDVAGELTQAMNPAKPRIDVDIPLEATAVATSQAKGYLRRHGERFAETAAQSVAQGVAEGRPTDAMVDDLRQRLNVTKSRATTIVRTESLRAYNDASASYYSAQGIQYVIYYATADDRSCPWCSPRAGRIYRRGEIRVPLHPQCRCYLAPWDVDLANIDPDYADARLRHQRQVEAAFKRTNQDPVDLNRAAVFEQYAPAPVV